MKGGQNDVFCWIFNQEKFLCRDVVFHEHIFPYQRIEDTSNEIDSPSIHDQSPFKEDQPITSQQSQVIFAYCDNVENNSNNNYVSKGQPILC